MNQERRHVPRKALETFRGKVENTIPDSNIGWIRTDADEVLFFHANYTRKRVLPEIGVAVKGTIARTADPARQDRAIDVEVDNERR